MTFVGKIIVVLQLVLTVCFMAFAGAVYTAETNWKVKSDSISEQKKQIEDSLNQLTAEMNAFKEESEKSMNSVREDLARSDSDLTSTTSQLVNAEKGLEEARGAVDRQTALAELAQEQANHRKEETLRQRERNERLQAQINDLLTKVRTLEDEKFAQENRIANMQIRQDEALANSKDYRDMLLALGASLDPKDYPDLGGAGTPPPAVVGRVLETSVAKDTGTEFVAVSLGKDDGFSTGNTLTVYRGGDYLGQITLTSVNADHSVGRLIPSTRARNGAIQKGDNVRP